MWLYPRPGVLLIPFGKKGYEEEWKDFLDRAPVAEDEAVDALTFRHRCGHVNDLRFYDVAQHLQGNIYECPQCCATWIVGEQ